MKMRAQIHKRALRRSPAAACESGFSLFELTIVIVIIGILLAVAINRLLPYIDEAERIAVLTTESTIRSSLVILAAKRIASGRSATLTEFNGSNPMALMLEAPANYSGEIDSTAGLSVPSRSWYFDVATRHLVYRPGRPFSWIDSGQAAKSPEFVVRVEFADNDGNGVFEPYRDELHGVRLLRVAGFEWLDGETTTPR